MSLEIERKYLVRRLPDLAGIDGTPMVQGYLRADADGSVRVRVAGARAWLTVKGPARGNARLEFEYEVPVGDARAMLGVLAVGERVEKVRYRLPFGGRVWELDVFSGRNQGLVLAEVELDDAAETPPLPPWVGREVSADARFLNASLARHPYRVWADRPAAE